MKNTFPNAYLTITEGGQKLNISRSAAYEPAHGAAIPACSVRKSTRIYTSRAGG